MGLRESLAERAASTSPSVLVGAMFMNLAIAVSLFVIAALMGSIVLMIAGAWLLLPAGTNAYLLYLDRDRI